MNTRFSKIIIALATFFIATTLLQGQKQQTQDGEKFQWFGDAKLGIFIHWGIYAVNGIDESWSFYNGYISHKDYLKQTERFTAANYDPDYWAGLIKKSGAKYAVITSKHHDGFALWNTKYGDLNAVKSSAAKRDVLSPFVKALRKNKLKVGLYYSLPDWSYNDYTHFTRNERRYDIKNEPERWNRFVNYYQGQLTELMSSYKPDLIWFDGDWEHSGEEWKAKETRDLLHHYQPNVIINSRLRGHGDYDTPEQGVPIARPKSEYWELCMTMNDSWGYQHNDKNYKTANQLIRIFVDCLNLGGNLLLDIGPKADGTIPEEQVKILEEFGRWTHKHKEAIYASNAGLPFGHYYGPTTLSKDLQTLYLFVPHRPNGPLIIKGLKNKINRIRVVGTGTKLSHQILSKQYWSSVPGLTYINLPEGELDDQMTVVAVQLKGKIDLYREDGQVIESN
ncbi:alpha-L-fucosidase [Tamlana sp. 2201CG12-4]|uniref:alpha-L-fucosidase n=1 Tax=Tamlana sp. 2201CG12-4 TaxID=3112582 RepID=UPI002DBE8D23|nr:alpha-L-fucosidase [Tamlana sp. 2201CG12-4]MEC3908238.1 alpha-L-fucosidase [Tamlana sp. 2201CG12-4]